jgi:hypothetical protein
MEKRGTHIGIIASFSIFILFLVGLYFIMEPVLMQEKDKDLIIQYLELKLIQDFSGNLTTVLINPNITNCMSINYTIIGVNEDINSIVKDKNNNIIDSEKHGSSLFIKNSTSSIIWIYYAYANFSNTSGISGPCTTSRIGSIRETKEIFEEKIINKTNNFQEFKDNLNITPGTEFSFSFEMENGTILDARVINTTREIRVKEVPIQYYNNQANKSNGKLRIKVW